MREPVDPLAPPWDWPILLVGLAGLVVLASVVVLLLVAANTRSPLAGGVGAAAGLQGAQVAGVHVFCAAVLVWLAFGVARQRGAAPRLRWPLALVGAAALLAVTALTGSMTNNPPTAVQLMFLAGTAALLGAFADRRDARAALIGLFAVVTLASAAAVLQYVKVLPYDVYLGTRRPIGIYSEPDWMGMFAAIGALLSLRLVAGRFRMPLFLLHVLVLMLAAARAAWLAIVVAVVIGYVASRITRRRGPFLPGGRIAAGLGVLGVAAALVASPSLRESLLDRVEGAQLSKPDVGAQARHQQIESLVELADQSPWYGLGLSASGRVGVSGRIAYLGNTENNVASNWVLGWWVDGGYLALPLILLFLLVAVRRAATTPGLILIVVLVSSMFSNAMLIPIAWLAVGLSLARERHGPPGVRPPDRTAAPTSRPSPTPTSPPTLLAR